MTLTLSSDGNTLKGQWKNSYIHNDCSVTDGGWTSITLTGKTQCTLTDSDNDGVPDERDTCPNTPQNSWVNKNGCPASGLYTEEQMNQMVQAILTWGDINGDKKIDLSEAIHALRVTSGITTPAIK